MKKLASPALFIIALIFANVIRAQEVTPSKYVIGGFFNLRSDKNTSTSTIITSSSPIPFSSQSTFKTLRASTSPYIAKQINSNSMLGLGFSYIHNRDKRESESSIQDVTTTLNTYGIELFYRKYLALPHPFQFFIEPYVSGSTSFGKIEQVAPILETNRANTFNTGVTLNIAYSISNWNIIANLANANYRHIKSRRASQEQAQKRNNFSVRTTFTNFRFGIERRF